jgi:hypothetical protein
MLSFPEPSPEPPHRALGSAETTPEPQSNAVIDLMETKDADLEEEIESTATNLSEKTAQGIILRLVCHSKFAISLYYIM